jgi:hypothetical protein
MLLLSGVLAFAALACGLIAASYAYRASKVPVDPGWTFEPVVPEIKQMGWTAATLSALQTAGSLSRAAAAWTMVAVILGAFASFAGLSD